MPQWKVTLATTKKKEKNSWHTSQGNFQGFLHNIYVWQSVTNGLFLTFL
jgi:hypothetical protein